MSSAGTVGALAQAMAERLRPALGDAAAGEARELLAALQDQPRHWVSPGCQAAV